MSRKTESHPSFLVRVRSSAGTWRLAVEGGKGSTVGEVKSLIERQYSVSSSVQRLCLDPVGRSELEDGSTLGDVGLGETGSLMYLVPRSSAAALPTVRASTVEAKATVRRKIGPDGSIIAEAYEDHARKRGFRPGMKALGDMKKAWTLTDFLSMDDQFNFKVKRQEEAACRGVALDTNSCVAFQNYLQQLAWRQGRCGWLYGTFENDDDDDENKDDKDKDKDDDSKKKKVVVDFVYEPEQLGDETGAKLFDDDDDDDDDEEDAENDNAHNTTTNGGAAAASSQAQQHSHSQRERVARVSEAATVEAIASAAGLRKVGFIFAHPPREKGFVFSGSEAIRAATQQLEAAGGVEKTPFVTVKVTVNAENESQFEAYQVSLQCMAMVAEGALGATDDDLASCAVHPTFTAVVEGKAAQTVDTNFFLCNVPVTQRASTVFKHAAFPKEHRIIPQTRDDLKRRIQGGGNQNLTDVLADFSLVLFLANFPQIFDHDSFLPALAHAITSNTPLDDGYRLILFSFAGIDF